MKWVSILGILSLTACVSRDPTPTVAVEKGPFRHKVTAEGNLKAAKVTRVTIPPEVERRVRLAWLAPEGRVKEGDLVARFDANDMNDLLREGRLDHESAILEVGKARRESDSNLAEFHTTYEVAELELSHAQQYQKTDGAVFSRHEIIEEAIDGELASRRKKHAAASRISEEARGKTQLEILEIRRQKAQMKIDQAERGLTALEVRAPHGGLFTLARGWDGEPVQAGQEMFRGQPIGEIPNLSVMEAEVFVLEADAGGLEVGKSATVTVEAFPERSFPARVTHLDAVAKPRYRGSPVQYFGLTLEFEAAQGLPMKPGHRVRAELLLEDIDQALVVPRQAVFTGNDAAGDDAYHVYVRKGSGFRRQEVEVGAKSVGLMVVTRGLGEGDEIALRPPSVLEEEEGVGS